MSDILGTSKQKKIIKGAFTYFRDGQAYCEETFEVFKDIKELTVIYRSQLLSRVSTGELLKISVDYTCNKDWVPIKAMINKNLGKEFIEETFMLDPRANILSYNIKSKQSKDKFNINTPPRFHIQTPCAATSMLFLLSKKFDSTTKNLYTVYASENDWSYEHPITTRNIGLEKIGLGAEEILINGNKIQAIKYRLMEEAKEEKSPSKDKKDFRPPSLIIYLSRHVGIPYKIEYDANNRIEIKFLNDLQEGEEEDTPAKK